MSKITYTVEVDENGNKHWYLDGKLHREDGPTIVTVDGTKFWHRHGKLHREDGPAIELVDGTKSWYLDDENVTEEEHRQRTTGKDAVVREWVGLTDEEIEAAGHLNVEGERMLPYSFARAIEAKLREKNA